MHLPDHAGKRWLIVYTKALPNGDTMRHLTHLEHDWQIEEKSGVILSFPNRPSLITHLLEKTNDGKV